MDKEVKEVTTNKVEKVVEKIVEKKPTARKKKKKVQRKIIEIFSAKNRALIEEDGKQRKVHCVAQRGTDNWKLCEPRHNQINKLVSISDWLAGKSL